MTVPENRSSGSTRTLELAVVIAYSSAAKVAPDPVVYLEGGPGGHAIQTVFRPNPPLFARVLQERDLIVFDQRGTGYSEPSLRCPEFAGLEVDPRAAATACAERLRSQGVDLSAYTTAENASDVEDLRVALGYESWNLYGISYGSRLALTTLRDHPAGVRTLAIDGVLPLDVDLLGNAASNAERAFELVFDACASDALCAQTYPSLGRLFRDTVAALNAAPAVLELDPSGTFSLTGDVFVQVLFLLLYSDSNVRYVPALIWQASQEQYDTLRSIVSQLQGGEAIDYGMYFALTCADEAPFTSLSELNRLSADVDPVYRSASDPAIFDVCRAFAVPASPPVENEPVSSSVPSLVTSGEFDPVTPPSYGARAAHTLAGAHELTLRGQAHGASISPCGQIVLTSFLDAPTAPDTSCVDRLPELEFKALSSRPVSRFVTELRDLPEELEQHLRERAGRLSPFWRWRR